jgi:hypothetical protein
MWKPIDKATPKDRPILLWFPDAELACKAEWKDRAGSTWACMIADSLSEQYDGVVWANALWTEMPG